MKKIEAFLTKIIERLFGKTTQVNYLGGSTKYK